MSSEEVRLQKFLSEAGVSSRRGAEKLILAGEISVNGSVVRELGTKVMPESDRVCVRDEPVELQSKRFYLFNKPLGVITTMRDTHGRPCVGDYVGQLDVRVLPVGRLDRDVSGLLIFTNDGEYANRLLHPRYGTPRYYWGVVIGKPKEAELTRLTRGVRLDTGTGKAESVRLVRERRRITELFGQLERGTSVVEVVVSEGQKHFVKKLFSAIGYPLEMLCRVSFGPYELGRLQPGKWTSVRKQAL